MARNNAYDSLELTSLALPYSPNEGELSGKPVLVDGYNTYTSFGRTLRKALGSLVEGSTTAITVRCDRLWIYETLDSTPVIYSVGSFKNGSIWELRYQQLSPTPGAWALATELRGSNHSAFPHEAVVKRGKLYVKGFPAAADDASKLGCVVLDGAGGTMATRLWGALGPTQPALLSPPTGFSISAASNAAAAVLTTSSAHGYLTNRVVTIKGATGSWVPINGTFVITVLSSTTFSIAVNSTGFGGLAGSPTIGWAASTHNVTVLNSWLYVYTWSLISGQETNRSPLQTNPDLAPSGTGAFTNKLPTMLLTNPPDTTNYPFINVYRTTDGGGTFYFVKQIVSTGTTTQVFQDTYLASGATSAVFSDPTPDAYLDTTRVSTGTQSNSPPPSVAPPQVTGTDTLKRSTRPVEYAGRIWYAIDEYLFYSALEELNEGVPEESFPSGLLKPNFFRLPATITSLLSTPSGLVIATRKETVRIQGTTRATFNPRPFLGAVGGAFGQRRAFCTAGENVAWLTQDYRVAVVRGDSYATITDPLGFALKDAAEAGADIELIFWAQGDKEWVIVAAHRPDDTTLSRWYIYDLVKARETQDDYWLTPWKKLSTALAVGQSAATTTQNKLFVTLWNAANTQLVYVDPTGSTNSDPDPTTRVATAYDYSVTTNLTEVPAGDHVNALRRPAFSPTQIGVQVERTNYAGDTDPTVVMYLDDFYTTPITMGAAEAAPRREVSKGFTVLVYNDPTGGSGWRNVKYAGMKVTGAVDTKAAEINRIIYSWSPESGC